MILTEPKNVRIRRVMAENGITQSELAKIEQDKIIEAIKEARA